MTRRPSLAATARAAAAAALGLALAPAHPAAAADPLGLYLGGAVGQARVEADGASFNPTSFKENHSAFKGMVGIRPVSLFGVEVAYVDFGDPSGSLDALPADVKMNGAAAFGVLDLPVSVVDVYAKLGVARLQSTVTGQTPIACVAIAAPCVGPTFRLERTNTGVAGGVGVQFKLGSAAVRGEYERFNAAGGSPGLVSLGVIWTL